jgi:hypothetical protein
MMQTPNTHLQTPAVFVIVRNGTLSGRPKKWYVSDLGRWALNLCSAKKFPTRAEAESYRAQRSGHWSIEEVS